MSTDAISKLPPHDTGLEQAVLGGLMLALLGSHVDTPESRRDTDHAGEAIQRLDSLGPDAWLGGAMGRHCMLFGAIRDLHGRSGRFDALDLIRHLEHTGCSAQVTEHQYLEETLEHGIPAAVSLGHYVDQLVRLARRRQLIGEGARIIREADSPTCEPESLVGASVSRLTAFVSSAGSEASERLEAAQELLRATESDSETPRVTTGYGAELDRLLGGGLGAGDLVIVGARPSMGKSAWGQWLCEYAACNGTSSALFSLEMTIEQLAQRLISGWTRRPWRAIRDDLRQQVEPEGLSQAMATLRGEHGVMAPVWYDATPGLSYEQLAVRARRYVSALGCRLIVVDYLGLMATPRAENRVQEVSRLSRQLKLLAGELQVPLVVLHQLNRGVETRQDRRPMLADLRESGSIEQDADVVLFLYRSGYYARSQRPMDDAAQECELIVRKNRHGATGSVTLAFIPQCTRFMRPLVEEAPLPDQMSLIP